MAIRVVSAVPGTVAAMQLPPSWVQAVQVAPALDASETEEASEGVQGTVQMAT